MIVDRELIISILKLTKEGSASHELVNKDAKIFSGVAEKLLRKLQNDGLIYLKRDVVEANSVQRLGLAVRAMQLGADVERVSSFLQWKEFEDMAAVAFDRNGYKVQKNLRFKHAGHRWEIDVLGYRKPLILCVDCKHWRRAMSPSALRKIVEEQIERTKALAGFLPSPSVNFEFGLWQKIELVPAVLSLVAGKVKLYDDVPIVPILQLQDFLSQLPVFASSFKHFLRLGYNL